MVCLWWHTSFAVYEHRLVWCLNIFVQRPNLLPSDPGVSHMPLGEIWLRAQQKLSNAAPLPESFSRWRTRQTVVVCTVWPIWATKALTSFRLVVVDSLRVLLSWWISLWGQQLWADLNILIHLMEALTGLCGTSGVMTDISIIFPLSCWESSFVFILLFY